MCQIFEQGEYFLWHAIAARADCHANDLRMGECLFVERTQDLDRSVRVGCRLKVGKEVTAILVTRTHAGDALIDLPQNSCAWQSPTGAKAAIVAERTAPLRHGAVNVGTRKSGIDADFLYTACESLSESEIVGVVTQSRLAPSGL